MEMTGRPNWYQKLTMAERKAYQLKRTKIMRMKRRQMTDEEREVARAKWRLAKQRQRQLRTREGPGHMTW